MFDFIARPFGQFLMILYEFAGNYGMALLLFAVAVKIILLPFQMKAKRGQLRQSRLQPKIAELQKRHGTNKAKINEEMAKLYKEEGVNPASGCLWGFIPIPILFALFQVIRSPLTMMMGVSKDLLEEGGAILNKLTQLGFESTVQSFYIQVDQAQFIAANFRDFQDLSPALKPVTYYFGLINLAEVPQWNFLWNTDWSNSNIWLPGLLLFIIPLISGGSQFISAQIIKKYTPTPAVTEGAGKSMQTMMMLMPLISVYFGYILPGALGFYWTIGTVLQIGQDIWLSKRYTRILDAEDEIKNRQRKARAAELEAKRAEAERRKAEGIIEKNPNTSKHKKHKTEKQEKIEKAVEYEKKIAPEEKKNEPGRIENRRYARGRAYDPERFKSAAPKKKKKKAPKEKLEDTEIELKDDVVEAAAPADDEVDLEVEQEDEDIEEADGDDDEDDGDGDDDDGTGGEEDDDDTGGDGEEDDGEDDDDDEDEDNEDDEDGEDDDEDDDDASSTGRFDTKRFDKD